MAKRDQGGNGSTGGDDAVKVGFCAILGLPNVGKSTLLNQVLDLRLVAVSRKPQTTRNRILGVHNTALPDDAGSPAGAAQIIFVDTPGIQKGPGALRRYMRQEALGAAGDSDIALLLIDVSDPAQRDPERLRQPDARALLDALQGSSAGPVRDGTKKPLLALNKIDLLPSREALLPIMAAYGDTGIFTEVMPISARTGNGVDRLVSVIGHGLPVGPRLFPEDMVTDRAERFLAGELIREQLFRQLGQELPYSSAVVVERFRDRPNLGDVMVEAVIYVERDSQKGMVVGKGGHKIKAVGQRARQAISQLLGCEAHVKLHVKVASHWSRLERGIRDMGYE